MHNPLRARAESTIETASESSATVGVKQWDTTNPHTVTMLKHLNPAKGIPILPNINDETGGRTIADPLATSEQFGPPEYSIGRTLPWIGNERACRVELSD